MAKTTAWILEKEPSKKLYAVVDPQSPNSFFDLARAFADGATRAYVGRPAGDDAAALANFNRAFVGDWAFDSTASTQVLDTKGNRVEKLLSSGKADAQILQEAWLLTVSRAPTGWADARLDGHRRRLHLGGRNRCRMTPLAER